MISSSNRLSYSGLALMNEFEERFDYLVLRNSVGTSTFGYERYLNQSFYRSREWAQVRQHVIARDEGCDLGIPGYEIYDKIIIHHMNPMTPDQIEDGDSDILNPDFLIACSLRTHNAIHFGGRQNLVQPIVERRPGDTVPWAQ